VTGSAHHISRALSVASIHLGPINESRRRAGLAALSADEVAREFADAERLPARGVATRRTSSTGAADGMWAAIVGKLNSTLPTRPPIAAGQPSQESSAVAGRFNAAVDWGSIASALNTEAGLKTPVRTNAR
jgi:hypothetical protein